MIKANAGRETPKQISSIAKGRSTTRPVTAGTEVTEKKDEDSKVAPVVTRKAYRPPGIRDIVKVDMDDKQELLSPKAPSKLDEKEKSVRP